jgi:hypothetical protein
MTLTISLLFGNDVHYDAGGKDEYQDDCQLMQGLIGTAPDGINLAAAAQTGAKAGTAGLYQDKYCQQDDRYDCHIAPDSHDSPLYIL